MTAAHEDGESEVKMTELKSNLGEVCEGDWVLTLQDGWQKIVLVEKKVADDSRLWCTEHLGWRRNGKRAYDSCPTCFPRNQVPKKFLAIYGLPPCELKDRDVVKVWQHDGSEYQVGIFKAYHPENAWDERYEIYGKIWRMWPYCEKWEGPEDEE